MEAIKTVFILRGVPGAGKTTIANKIVGYGVICQTDDFIEGDPNQVYNQSIWDKARETCKETFLSSLYGEYSPIVVANTNTTSEEVDFYREAAEKRGYIVHVMVIEKYHSNLNVHYVPKSRVDKYRDRLKHNIKL